MRALSNSAVAYTRGDKVGVMDVTTGTRTELAGAGSAATTALLLAAGADGIRTQTKVLSAEAAGAPALADGRAYWLDAAGQPQTKALTPATDGEL